MKKQILLTAIAVAALFSFSADAQVGVSVNIGVQPVWGPVGYDHADYYYIPDIDAYYDVPHRRYTYYEGGRWVTRMSLPPRYHDFDLYGAHKVVMNEQTPWRHHDRDVTQYSQYRGQHDQQVIRDSHDDRYRANPNHPEHNQWHGNNGHNDHGNNGHGDRGNQHHENGYRQQQGHGNNQQHDNKNNQQQGRENEHQDRGNHQHQDDRNTGHEEHGNENHH